MHKIRFTEEQMVNDARRTERRSTCAFQGTACRRRRTASAHAQHLGLLARQHHFDEAPFLLKPTSLPASTVVRAFPSGRAPGRRDDGRDSGRLAARAQADAGACSGADADGKTSLQLVRAKVGL